LKLWSRVDLYALNYVLPKNLEELIMIEDPIVKEIHDCRKKHAAKYGNELKRIVEALRKQERNSKRILLNPGPKLLLKRIGS